MKKILSKRERLILYSTIGLILFSIIFNFLIAPALKRNDDLNKEIALTRLKLKKYMRLMSEKEAINARYAQFSLHAANLTDQKRDTALSALSELENFAHDAGIRILDIRPQALKTLGAYKENNVELKTEGSMEGLLKFMYDIEHSLSLLEITRLRLALKPGSSLLEAVFSISSLSPLE